jgi:cell pole-organizing protein PopZ
MIADSGVPAWARVGEKHMSLAAPENQIPETEALQRAQRAHEPSMEEILASIRAIIADDTAPPKIGPQLVYASDAPARPQPEAPRKAEPVALAPEAPAALAPEAPAAAEPLLSEAAGAAVSGSFRALSDSMAAHGVKVAEDMAREMLRPMLKTWLDENMPAMVERLVRAEIERVTQAGR